MRPLYVLPFLGSVMALGALFWGRTAQGRSVLEGLASPSSPTKQATSTGPGQVWDYLQDHELRLKSLQSEAQLLRHEWEDSYSKMRRVEERLKKQRQREQPDEQEYDPPEHLVAQWENGSLAPESAMPTPVPTSPATSEQLEEARAFIFQQRLGGRYRG